MSISSRAVSEGAKSFIHMTFDLEELIIEVHTAVRRLEFEIAGRVYRMNLLAKRQWIDNVKEVVRTT